MWLEDRGGMITLTKLAEAFATAAHAGQKRKYTGEPYINHCKNVVAILEEASPFHAIGNAEPISAAWLHDTLEDTKVTHADIVSFFGARVARLVKEVTDVSTKEDGNRAVRKQKDLEHLALASPEAQTIKLADLISNTQSIVKHDPEFAKVYMLEKKALLKVLTKGDRRLHKLATDICEKHCEELGVY